jgi:hypothetical protein
VAFLQAVPPAACTNCASVLWGMQAPRLSLRTRQRRQGLQSRKQRQRTRPARLPRHLPAAWRHMLRWWSSRPRGRLLQPRARQLLLPRARLLQPRVRQQQQRALPLQPRVRRLQQRAQPLQRRARPLRQRLQQRAQLLPQSPLLWRHMRQRQLARAARGRQVWRLARSQPVRSLQCHAQP